MSNVSSSEIEQFDNLANHWWDVDGKLKTLHDINPLRVQYIQQHCQLRENTVLDIGCGGGILSESLAKAGAKVTAIDLSEPAIEVAKQHAKQQKLSIDYRVQSAEDMAEQAPQFDVITCLELLEHVPDPGSVIKAASQCLKPGGQLVLSTINRTIKAYLMAIVGAEYVLNLIPRGTHHYQQLIRPSELTNWCRQANLSLKHLQGMSYNPITRQASNSDDVGVNYLAVFIRQH